MDARVKPAHDGAVMMRKAMFSLLILLLPCAAHAQSCPAPLRGARRLVLVLAPTMSSSTASLTRYVRAAPGARWYATGGPASALIGHKGVGWSEAFAQYARRGEPLKVEGDKRAPAGFFRIGPRFGFAAERGRDYLRVTQGTVCVSDARSPAYNTIISRAKVGWTVRGENMWRIPEYRRGLLVDYPTDRKRRAGSCIFIHLRLPGATGTSGCVSVPEPRLIALQRFAAPGAVLAILPRQALDRFKGCLPEINPCAGCTAARRNTRALN
jgi:L,D-peptidoglycan transpeptidase YkuD (ErfK/YbiS/YcfS/YnhG family)